MFLVKVGDEWVNIHTITRVFKNFQNKTVVQFDANNVSLVEGKTVDEVAKHLNKAALNHRLDA